MHCVQTGATHYHAQLGLTDIGRAIKGLVVCLVIRLESSKRMGLRTSTRCVGLVPCCSKDGYRAQVPQCPPET